MLSRQAPRRMCCSAQCGFTLIELMVTLALLAILLGLAVPFITTAIRNASVRSASEALQNGLRTAQAEAVRRNRQTVFSLTDEEPGSNSAAAANGANWAIHTVPRADEDHEFVQGGALSDLTRGATIEGPASICFNSAGRLVGNTDPGVEGANCEAQQLVEYTIEAEGADRPLSVQVTLGGQVRMCEPTMKLSSESPQGCKP